MVVLLLPGCTKQTASPVGSTRVAASDSAKAPSPGAINNASPNNATVGKSAWQSQVAALRDGQSDTLRVEGHPISASELTELEQLDGPLEQLLIEAGGVDDSTMHHIAAVKSLVHLRLRECPISDAGLETLTAGDLLQLQIVNIPQGLITARGIESLAQLPSLVQLRLGGRQVDDSAVSAIARLSSLRSLHLIGPALTDNALAELSVSPRLSSFYLDDCPLSDSAWEALFAAKPKLHVHIDQQHHDRDPQSHEPRGAQ